MPPLAESTCSDSEAGAATLCEDPRLTARLDEMFTSALADDTRCWELGSDGGWTASPRDGRPSRDHQVTMMERRQS